MSEIEVAGFWSIPNNTGNNVEGTLYLDPSKGILKLILYSSEPIGLMRKIDIISGRTIQGSEVTLYDCYVAQEKIRVGANRKYESLIDVKYVYDGIKANKKGDLLFHEVNFRFTNLDEWAYVKGFDLYTVEDCDFSLIHKHPDSVIFEIDKDTTISINTGLVSPMALIVEKEVKVTQRVYVSIQHNSPQPIEKSIELIKSFMGLVSLGIGRAVNFTEIFGFNPNHYQSIGENERKHFYKIRVYNGKFTDEQYNGVDPRDTLLNLQDIKENFGEIMKAWLEKSLLLQPVIDLYLTSLNYSEMSIERHFLTLVQALEAFHRRTRQNFVIPDEVHRQRNKMIVETAPEEHRPWLKQILYYGNEPTLKDRLIELTHDGPDYWVFFNDKQEAEKFSTDVKNTRNYHTHYDQKLSKKALTGEELELACFYLKIMIEYYLLKEIGIEKDFVREKIVRVGNRIRDRRSVQKYWRDRTVTD